MKKTSGVEQVTGSSSVIIAGKIILPGELPSKRVKQNEGSSLLENGEVVGQASDDLSLDNIMQMESGVHDGGEEESKALNPDDALLIDEKLISK